MGITINDAIVKSMRLYWLKTDEYDAMTSNKDRKYTKKYFDGMEKDSLNTQDQSQEAIPEIKKVK